MIFEKQLITEMKQFTQKISKSWLTNVNPAHCIVRLLITLETIQKRLIKCIPLEDSCMRIIQECYKNIVLCHTDYLLEFFSSSLKQKIWENMDNLFKLIKPLEDLSTINLVTEMLNQFKVNVKGKCFEMLSYLKENDQRFKMNLIENLAQFYQKHSNLIDNFFHSSKLFKQSLNAVFIEVIYQEPYTISASNCVQYIDNYLTNSNRSLNENDTMHLFKVINIVKFIKDKDSFKMFYINALSKRLIFSKFTFDQEQLLIERLCTEFEWQYISKLKKMVKDISGTALLLIIIIPI